VIAVDEWSTTLRTIKQQLEQVDPFKVLCDLLLWHLFLCLATSFRQLSRENRLKLVETREEIMRKIASLDHVLAEWIRGTLNNAALARAQDIRYAAVFTKARRQRVLDERAQRNAKKCAYLIG